MDLPAEVLAVVFSYLDMYSLDISALVCRKWHDAAGDQAWRELFLARFGTTEAPQLTGTRSWRREFKARASVLAMWRRGSRSSTANVSYNSLIWDVTDLFVDFAASRLICYNTHRGLGNISDPRIGKVSKRRIYASKHSHEQTPVACVDGSRFGLVYGFYDGRVAAVALAKESVVSSYLEMPFRHQSGVTAVWIAKTQKFSETIPGVCLVSAGRDGYVHLVVGPRVPEMRESQKYHHKLSDCAIVKIQATPDIVVAIDSETVLYVIRDNDFQKLGTVAPGIASSIKSLEILGQYAVVEFESAVYRVDLDNGLSQLLEFPAGIGNRVSAFAVDKSEGLNEPKHVAVATHDNYVAVWRVPGPLEPVWYNYMALPLDRTIDSLGKPSVTKLALNSVVLLQAGYNGLALAVDVLTGKPLRQVSSRIPRTILDFSRYSADGLVPVTHLEVDPNPWRPQGIISVRPMVQYFDLEPGSGKMARALQQQHVSQQQHTGPRRRRSRGMSSQDIAEEVEARLEVLDAQNEREELEGLLREQYGVGDLEEDEELAYAVALSQQEPQDTAARDQRELELALSLSQQNNASSDSDDDLRRVLELSLHET